MATRCKKCGGIIPDILIGYKDDLYDCRFHQKSKEIIEIVKEDYDLKPVQMALLH